MILAFNCNIDRILQYPLCLIYKFLRLNNQPAFLTILKITKLLSFLAQVLVQVVQRLDSSNPRRVVCQPYLFNTWLLVLKRWIIIEVLTEYQGIA